MHFRVTRPTFEALCDLVRGDLQKQHTRMRSPVSVEERVGLALWRLAAGDSFKSCGLQFGLGMSTAKTICAEFELSLLRLKDRFIKFPLTRQELKELMDEFEEEYRIPQIVGAIDGCHIEINAPPDNHEDYFNRKQHYSVNLQAVVDCSLKFIHVSFGYPGSIHDARVLRLSGLFDLGENEQILTSPKKIVSGTEIPPLIIGDSAYPLLKWLVKPDLYDCSDSDSDDSDSDGDYEGPLQEDGVEVREALKSEFFCRPRENKNMRYKLPKSSTFIFGSEIPYGGIDECYESKIRIIN
ncbi:hypothetical protein ACROYT_G032377 [Oculina patagonica]